MRAEWGYELIMPTYCIPYLIYTILRSMILYVMKCKLSDGKERTAVRGRRLDGVRVELPEGYECRLLLQKGMGEWGLFDGGPEPENCLLWILVIVCRGTDFAYLVDA